MLKIASNRFVIRLLSLSVALGTLVVEAIAGLKVCSFSGICMCLLSGMLVLQLSPDSYDRSDGRLRLSSVISMAIFVCIDISLLLGLDVLNVMAAFVSLVIVLISVADTLLKYGSEEFFCRGRSVRYGAENCAKLVYALACLCVCMLVIQVNTYSAVLLVRIITVAIISGLYALLYYRAYSGRTMIMSESNERKLYAAVVRFDKLLSRDPEEMRRLNELFDRIETIMRTEKKYTNPELSEDDVALMVGDNRTYVSRAVNYVTGESFPKYINGLRVKESIELMKGNPDYTVMDLAIICGFNTKVTYINAFKDVMKTTPGKYRQEVILPQHLSNMKVREP